MVGIWLGGQVCLTGILVGNRQQKEAVEWHLESPWNSPTSGLVSSAGLSDQAGENILGQVPQGNDIAGLTPLTLNPYCSESTSQCHFLIWDSNFLNSNK